MGVSGASGELLKEFLWISEGTQSGSGESVQEEFVKTYLCESVQV